jgi:hypothetical protein
MTRVLMAVLVLTGAAACKSEPPRPIVPVDQQLTLEIYDVTLGELKRIMTPPAGTTVPIDWSTRMYLNPLIVLPPADSANPLSHDPGWINSVLARGMVQGVCGKPPATPCPPDQPVAFTSLTPPWTMGGDTVYVQGGYAGEIPGETRYESLFWTFTLAHDEAGALKVVRRGPPTRTIFETR